MTFVAGFIASIEIKRDPSPHPRHGDHLEITVRIKDRSEFQEVRRAARLLQLRARVVAYHYSNGKPRASLVYDPWAVDNDHAPTPIGRAAQAVRWATPAAWFLCRKLIQKAQRRGPLARVLWAEARSEVREAYDRSDIPF